MKYLLDSNIYLWSINDDDRLPKEIKRKIDNSECICFISIVSIWEMQLKFYSGKLQLKDPLKELLKESMEKSSLEILNINSEAIFFTSELPNFHKDPFDRLIIAQSRIENIELLFTDKIFHKYIEFFNKLDNKLPEIS